MASLELTKVTLETISVELDKTSSVELAKMGSFELDNVISVDGGTTSELTT